MRRIDLYTVKRRADLLALVERDTVLKRSASTRGGEWKGPCPICGHKGGSDQDGFSVLPNASPCPLWLCRTCTGGKYRSVIDYIALRDHLDPTDRDQLLAICQTALDGCELPTAREPVMRRPAPVPPAAIAAPEGDWQAQAKYLIETSEDQLWSPAGKRGLTYLREARGLQDRTIRRFRLGFNAQDRWMDAAHWGCPGDSTNRIWLPRGIVIPCVIRGAVWSIKFRRSKGEGPKYMQVRGSRPALFNAEDLIGADLALITEGEIDAMTTWQELGDIMACVSFGSSTNLPDLAVFGPYLRQVSTFLMAYDQDRAGENGVSRVTELIRRAVPCTLPAGIKDINDLHTSGVDLYQWIEPFLPPL